MEEVVISTRKSGVVVNESPRDLEFRLNVKMDANAMSSNIHYVLCELEPPKFEEWEVRNALQGNYPSHDAHGDDKIWSRIGVGVYGVNGVMVSNFVEQHFKHAEIRTRLLFENNESMNGVVSWLRRYYSAKYSDIERQFV